MVDDYLVKRRQNREIRSIAAQIHKSFNLNKRERVDVISCLKSGSVMTLWGQKELTYEVVPDWEMGDDDALTIYEPNKITIRARNSVNDRALFGDDKARMTLAHELGHAVMHPGAPKARRHIGNVTPKFIPCDESAECQADAFSSEFLLPESEVSKYKSPEDIAVYWGISIAAAEDRFRDPLEAIHRAEGADRLKSLAAEIRSKPPCAQQPAYIDQQCAVCGEATLMPIGIKYHCKTCDNVTDLFQDGDR